MTANVRTTRRIESYAALVRLPNLFTAPPDVILGAATVAAAGETVSAVAVGTLAVASMLLYAGGTTLNDAFDAPEDAQERPERPIPSGQVPRTTGFGLGIAFLSGGILLASTVAVQAAAVAAVLAGVILLYDGVLKGTAAGWAAMGGTRGLNVLLGAVAAGTFDIPVASFAVAATVAGYVAAVTYMADTEVTGGDRRAVVVAGIGALGAGLAVGGYLAFVAPPIPNAVLATGLAIVFVLWTGRALRKAYADPVPETVGPAVGASILGLVVLDAAFAAATGIVWGLTAAAFFVPAAALARVFDVS